MKKSVILLERLAQDGYQIVSAKFSSAVYDGTNDVQVSVEDRGPKRKAVLAIGNATLFIEFGAGVSYPDNHPEAHKHGMNRGEYGQGKGSQPFWGYYGDPGTNGVIREKKSGKSVVITKGNPANMPMYSSVKNLKEHLTVLAREVFDD